MEPTVIIWIIGIILSILLGIIGFFLAYFFKRSMGSTDRLDRTVEKLGISITGMNGIILSSSEKFDKHERDNDRDINHVNTKVEKHERRIDDHEKRIIIIEQRI